MRYGFKSINFLGGEQPKELVTLSTITEKKENNRLEIRRYFKISFDEFLIVCNIDRPTAVLSKSASQNEDVEEGLTVERIRYEPQENVNKKLLLFTQLLIQNS